MLIPGDDVHLVMGPDGIILRAYRNGYHAQMHARAITGAVVVSVDVAFQLDESIQDDIAAEAEWEDYDSETPVLEVPFGDINDEEQDR